MIYLGNWLTADLRASPYDLVIADPPYGDMIACSWDKPIDLKEMWSALGGRVTNKAVIVFTAAQPFTARLVLSNEAWFRHEIIWEKTKAVGHLQSKSRPLRAHENILVFSPAKLGAHTYNPQFEPGEPYAGGKRVRHIHPVTAYGTHGTFRNDNPGIRYPRSVWKIQGVERGWHPTRKPVELMRRLVLTFSNPGDRVLEPYGGSCPVHQACQELTDRSCDSFEINRDYYEKAVQ